jgi:hypothetical protein
VNPDGIHQIDGQSNTLERACEMLDTSTVESIDTTLCTNVEPCQSSSYVPNILRQIHGCPGIYIGGSVQDIKVDWTMDTGASRTIISK